MGRAVCIAVAVSTVTFLGGIILALVNIHTHLANVRHTTTSHHRHIPLPTTLQPTSEEAQTNPEDYNPYYYLDSIWNLFDGDYTDGSTQATTDKVPTRPTKRAETTYAKNEVISNTPANTIQSTVKATPLPSHGGTVLRTFTITAGRRTPTTQHDDSFPREVTSWTPKASTPTPLSPTRGEVESNGAIVTTENNNSKSTKHFIVPPTTPGSTSPVVPPLNTTHRGTLPPDTLITPHRDIVNASDFLGVPAGATQVTSGALQDTNASTGVRDVYQTTPPADSSNTTSGWRATQSLLQNHTTISATASAPPHTTPNDDPTIGTHLSTVEEISDANSTIRQGAISTVPTPHYSQQYSTTRISTARDTNITNSTLGLVGASTAPTPRYTLQSGSTQIVTVENTSVSNLTPGTDESYTAPTPRYTQQYIPAHSTKRMMMPTQRSSSTPAVTDAHGGSFGGDNLSPEAPSIARRIQTQGPPYPPRPRTGCGWSDYQNFLNPNFTKEVLTVHFHCSSTLTAMECDDEIAQCDLTNGLLFTGDITVRVQCCTVQQATYASYETYADQWPDPFLNDEFRFYESATHLLIKVSLIVSPTGAIPFKNASWPVLGAAVAYCNRWGIVCIFAWSTQMDLSRQGLRVSAAAAAESLYQFAIIENAFHGIAVDTRYAFDHPEDPGLLQALLAALTRRAPGVPLYVAVVGDEDSYLPMIGTAAELDTAGVQLAGIFFSVLYYADEADPLQYMISELNRYIMRGFHQSILIPVVEGFAYDLNSLDLTCYSEVSFAPNDTTGGPYYTVDTVWDAQRLTEYAQREGFGGMQVSDVQCDYTSDSGYSLLYAVRRKVFELAGYA
ncbi:ORF34 [Ranid herpesvirus 1]|uniref:ORF34 n=1 Tax=Ranid herpesvirus 1 TaxID=85655 RepID=Q14VS4_9VIRU|nr:ORF34 [Ranid herpesvirus 1]ABG25717.1 ORF34 [Ranid herpesvirus 1]